VFFGASLGVCCFFFVWGGWVGGGGGGGGGGEALGSFPKKFLDKNCGAKIVKGAEPWRKEKSSKCFDFKNIIAQAVAHQKKSCTT